MSNKYKFGNERHAHFVTYTVVHWIDFFIRNEYRNILIDSIKFCQEKKGLEVHAYCIMPSHVHMIIGTAGSSHSLEGITRDLKGIPHDVFAIFFPMIKSITKAENLGCSG